MNLLSATGFTDEFDHDELLGGPFVHHHHTRMGEVVAPGRHGGGRMQRPARLTALDWMDLPFDQLEPHQQDMRAWMESARDVL